MRRASGLIFLVFLLPSLSANASILEDTSADLRVTFADVGRAERIRDESPQSLRSGLPDPYNMLGPILNVPTDVLLRAVDEALNKGSIEERIGALEIYFELLHDKREIPNREYHSRIVHLLTKDDLKVPSYTRMMAGNLLYYYRSRETLLTVMGTAARAKQPGLREELLWNASVAMGISLPLTQHMEPTEKMRILADFEEWFNKNRDRIRFDSKGWFHMGGGGFKVEKKTLDVQDRERIRKDPVCVLRLMSLTAGAEDEPEDRGMTLLDRCGSALYGSGGAELIRKTLVATEKGGEPSLDLQAAMGSIGGQYPVLDAALVAAAYVAAYESDHGARELARRTLEQFLEGDIDRVTRGEPREVRKAAAKLADEVAYGENKK